ncbi:MAG: hypothetical protein ABIY40_02745, partial [Rhodanobacteraceae bacterium]
GLAVLLETRIRLHRQRHLLVRHLRILQDQSTLRPRIKIRVSLEIQNGIGNASRVRTLPYVNRCGRRCVYLHVRMHLLRGLRALDAARLPELRRRIGAASAPRAETESVSNTVVASVTLG